MTTTSVGFIGGGRITRILLGGWSRAGCVPSQVHVSDPNEATLHQLQQQFPAIGVSTQHVEAASQPLVFLAVHPPVLAETLSAIRDSLRDDALLVSLAPKFTVAKITELLGGFRRVVRSIPNAPSLVNRGYNPLFFASGLGDEDQAGILALLEPLGKCPLVEEPKLEAYAILTAMGPTYFWPQFFELIDLAQNFGLSPEEAIAGLEAMVTGSLATLTESKLDRSQVLDLVPVQPLAEEQTPLREAYRRRLTEIFQKIHP